MDSELYLMKRTSDNVGLGVFTRDADRIHIFSPDKELKAMKNRTVIGRIGVRTKRVTGDVLALFRPGDKGYVNAFIDFLETAGVRVELVKLKEKR